MCQSITQITLCENSRGYISWCRSCQLYSFVYETCCIAFTRNEFQSFRQVLDGLDEAHFVPSQNGRKTVFLRSARGYMGICLTGQQVEDLKIMFEEASHMYEIFALVYQ